MAFTFEALFEEVDPECVARFRRTFQHRDWIDGESVVQAESTTTQIGFNELFRTLRDDIDGIENDGNRAFECLAQLRSNMSAIIRELETELSRLGGTLPEHEWQNPPLLNGWTSGIDSHDGQQFAPPSYRRDAQGVVRLVGRAARGPQPTRPRHEDGTIFVLKGGYQPRGPIELPVLMGGGTTNSVLIDVNGRVILNYEYTDWVAFDGVTFQAD